MDIIGSLKQKFAKRYCGEPQDEPQDNGIDGNFDVLVELYGQSNEHIHEWWKFGQLTHRPHGPAKILYDRETGLVLKEQYRNMGRKHRIDGPAVREIDLVTRVVTKEEFYKHDKLHNKNGPAIIIRDVNTNEVTSQKFYIDGQQLEAEGLDNSRP